MTLLSKKQVEHLLTAAGLAAAAILLFFPAGWTLPRGLTLVPALLSGILSLGLAHSMLSLGTLPPQMRAGALLPLAVPASMFLMVFPDRLTVIGLLLPPAFLLLKLRPRLPGLPAPAFIPAAVLPLTLAASRYWEVLMNRPNSGLPPLPYHLGIWISILVIIPLGFATRPMLRPLAKMMARTLLWIVMVLFGLYPLLWCAATSFKVPGEPLRNFHSLKPQPRFFLVPKDEMPDLTPPVLAEAEARKVMLSILEEMSWRLTDTFILTTFQEDSPFPPGDMLRSMKLYGFLLEDRHGNFLPGAAFSRQPPGEMSPEYLPSFRRAMDRMVLGPQEIKTRTKTSAETVDKAFRELRKLNLIHPVPGGEDRYRLTSQARHPFGNGLLPRQVLLLNTQHMDRPLELVQTEYVPRRELGVYQILSEFQELEEQGAVRRQRVWQWNQHREFLGNRDLWLKAMRIFFFGIASLMAGGSLPLKHTGRGGRGAGLAGGLLLLLPAVLFPFLRPGLALWMVRKQIPLTRRERFRLASLAVCCLIPVMIVPLSASAALVHQCAWTLLWTPPALLCLLWTVTPGKPAANPS